MAGAAAGPAVRAAGVVVVWVFVFGNDRTFEITAKRMGS